MTRLPGRNDPCHCGSGLKYKKCHEARDRDAAGSPKLRLLANAPSPQRARMLNLPSPSELNREWEMEIAPVPGSFEDDPAARTAALIIAAPPFVLACELLNQPPAEPDELAALLAQHITDTADAVGVEPLSVAVRHASLQAPLARLLKPHNTGVQHRTVLPGVDDALRSLLAHVFGGIVPLGQLRAEPETWAGWGMPTALVARLFRAAAAYHRAAPWHIVADDVVVHVSRSGEHEWTAVVLGGAGVERGLALYENIEDVQQLFDHDDDDPAGAFDNIHGAIISLLYHERSELPKRMRAEIQAAGWDVASPNAYPALMVLNTPGGSIRQRHFEDLIGALESVPRFVAKHSNVFAGDTIAESEAVWTDPDNGVTCRIELADNDVTAAFPAPPEQLEPSGPSGSGATPLANLDPADAVRSVNRTLTRFRAWLRKTPHQPPLDAAVVREHGARVRLFVELIAHTGMKPVTAVNEYDLREFLYDWYPRKVQDSAPGAADMLLSLRVFFEFLEAREDVVCVWAGPILDDHATFWNRWSSFPGGYFWDAGVQEWQSVLTADLAARLLLPVSSTRGGIEWGDTMGPVEYALNREAHRRWIVARDEAIARGTVSNMEILDAVLDRQREWATEPNEMVGGRTPRDAITRERKEMGKRARW